MTTTKNKGVLLPVLLSVLVALGLTYLVLLYLPLIITGVLLLIAAVVIFSAVASVTWFLMQLVFTPYYAIRKPKPREEESQGGYRLEEVKCTESEGEKPDKQHCPQCGAESKTDAKFCPNCGAEFR